MATYYVKNGGSDNNTGLSDAQAWATIGKVNGFSFSDGDDVYFKCGSSWNTKTDATLSVDWSGLDINNYVVIGAYYMNGGKETVGVNVDGKPFFDGGWKTTSDFQTIIQPYDANYVLFQDLGLYNSYGMGFLGHVRHPNTYITLRRLRIGNTGRSSIVFDSCGIGGVIEYCNTSEDNLRWKLGSIATWGGGVVVRSDGCIVRYNEVHEGYGEGINIGARRATSNALVENNLVWAQQSYNIYLDGAQDCTVRNNVSLGTTDPTWHKAGSHGGRTWNPMGIGLNSERTNITLRNEVYNNVCAGCYRGIQCMNLNGSIPSYLDRNLVYNNTLIDNYCNSYCHNTQCLTTEFKNNLSIVHNDGVHRVDPNGNGHVWFKLIPMPSCYLPLGNMWAGIGNDDMGDWSHTNDVVGDAKLYKTSGWQNISKPSDINIAASFALTTGSDAIDSAQNLGGTYDAAFIKGTNFNVADASDANTPIVVVLGDQGNYGAGWDIGAFVHSTAAALAKGRIVNLDHPMSLKYGEICDIKAATENIGTAPGVFEMQLLIDSILKSKSLEFVLEGGAISNYKIEPFTAPLTGESMDIVIKCIQKIE